MNNDDILRSLRVGTPCPMKFDDLEGSGAKRWCGECRLHVYDFAQLTRSEVTELVRTTEGRLCGRVVRRPDGTVLTKDCGPVRTRRRRLGTAAAALLATAAPFGLSACAPGSVECGGTPVPTPGQVDPSDGGTELLGEVRVPEKQGQTEEQGQTGEPAYPEELGDIAIQPAGLVPAVRPDPPELLGRIVAPRRDPAPPAPSDESGDE